MAGKCEITWFDESRVGKPKWGTGDEKTKFDGYEDGWRPCGHPGRDMGLDGQQRTVCDEHRRQIMLLMRIGSPLLKYLRWR